MISCYHLNIKHPRTSGMLFDDLGFELETGAWADITGENGSGKSVLFRVLSLRARLDQGTLIVAGRNTSRLSRRRFEGLRRRIGACEQDALLLEDRSVVENLLVPFIARGETRRAPAKVDHLLETLDIKRWAKLQVSTLTPSEKRVVAIARACVGEPSIVMIDGGLEGLTPEWTKKLRQHLRRLHREGRTVLIFSQQAIGPMLGDGVELRLEDGRLEQIERSLRVPNPEIGGPRR